MTPSEETALKVKQEKIRKKNITVTKEYMESTIMK